MGQGWTANIFSAANVRLQRRQSSNTVRQLCDKTDEIAHRTVALKASTLCAEGAAWIDPNARNCATNVAVNVMAAILAGIMSEPTNPVPLTVRAALEASGCEYEILECDPELADTAVFCAHYGHAMDDSANAILVKSKTGKEKFVACVLLATTRLDVNRVVRKKMGARKVSFADPDETKHITGMELGGVTPPGLPAGLPLWVDARVMDRPFVILGAGTRSAKLKVASDYFLTLPQVEIVEELAKEAE